MKTKVYQAKQLLIKRILAGILLAAVVVCPAGCGKKKSVEKTDQTDISADSVVMMVGNHEVRYNEVMVYCYFLKCQYEKSFGKELWDYQIKAGETIGDQAKQEIVNTITQMKIISEVAEEQEISLTADEQDDSLQAAEQLLRDASEADKEQYLLTIRSINEVYQENALAAKMYYVATDDADADVSDEEAKQRVLRDRQAGDLADQKEQNVSEEQIAEAKEKIIQERQSDMFAEKYAAWLQDKDVDINQDFWNRFSL